MLKHLLKFTVLLFLSFFIACAPTLKKHIRKLGYEPFELPRDFNGEGTIFRIMKGEELVWRASESCLPEELIERSSGKVFSFLSYTMKSKTSINFMNFIKDISKAASGISGKKVVKIRIIFKDAFSRKLPIGDVAEKLRYGELTEACTEDLVDKKSFLIVDILGVKEMKYEFILKDNLKLELNEDIISNILSMKAGIDYNLETKYRLAIDFPCYIGYKAIRFYKVIEKDEKGNKFIKYKDHAFPQRTLEQIKKMSLRKK